MITTVRHSYRLLAERHYLGPTKKAEFGWVDEFGVMVFAAPRSRRLPARQWLELVRWCLGDEKNSGSRQWAAFVRWAHKHAPHVTTVISYSDPSVGHTGALYRACGWLWAPTWLRIRPPPSGNGEWTDGRQQSVKDRWVYPLQPDAGRAALLTLNDEALMKHSPWLEYREPAWHRGRFDPRSGGGDFKRWRALTETAGER